ncbi:MAG: hypothetical protein ACO1SX_12480 [Actinomycetota bacterium]
MILYDPIGAITRVSLACILNGLVWAVMAVVIIHTGSTRLIPRLPSRMIWSGWRRKRMIWGLGLTLPLIGTVLLSELIARWLGLADIYWMAREEALLTIGRLAGILGYLLALFSVVVVALVRRKRARGPAPDTSKAEA